MNNIPLYGYGWWWWFSCKVVSDSWDPMDCSPSGSSAHDISQARLGVGCHYLLQYEYIRFYWFINQFMLSLFSYMGNTAINIDIQAFIWIYVFISLGHMPRYKITKSYSNSVYSIWRNCQTLFQSGGTILWSIQLPVSPHLCQHLLLPVFFMSAF